MWGVLTMNAISRIPPLLIAIALSIGCQGVSNPPAGGTPFGARVLVDSAAALAHEYYSGLRDSTRLVIADPATWATTWMHLYTGRRPQPPLPAIDFGTERVLLAALGERPTGGFDIRIDSIVRFEFGTVAYLSRFAPGQSCFTTQALTQPVDLVRFSTPLTPLAFEQRAVVRDCT